MKKITSKTKYIPPQFFSSEGMCEIISALENTEDPILKKEFPGELLFATRKYKNVSIDEKLMQKLEMTAKSCFQKGLLLKEDYKETVEKIKKLRKKYKI